jgi:hypothetical protein
MVDRLFDQAIDLLSQLKARRQSKQGLAFQISFGQYLDSDHA